MAATERARGERRAAGSPPSKRQREREDVKDRGRGRIPGQAIGFPGGPRDEVGPGDANTVHEDAGLRHGGDDGGREVFVPTGLPPETSTASAVRSALRIAARITSSRSGSTPKSTGMLPAALMSARSAYWLTFRTCPARGVTSGGTISSPVAITATRGRRTTHTRASPIPESAPTSAGRMRWPRAKRRVPFLASSPRRITCCMRVAVRSMATAWLTSGCAPP